MNDGESKTANPEIAALGSTLRRKMSGGDTQFAGSMVDGRTAIIGCENESDCQKKVETLMSDILTKAITERGGAKIAVSGGSMPALVAPLLPKLIDIDWSKVRIFAADERMVELNDKESNTGAYVNNLPENISKSFVEYGPIDNTEECAKNYEERMRKCNIDTEEGWPVFDLLLLGIGPDGHTCSLFPGHTLLKEKVKWVAAIEDSPKPPPRRITLTLPVINHARNIAFISTDSKKSELIRKIVDNSDPSLPAAMVKPKSGLLTWYVGRQTVI